MARRIKWRKKTEGLYVGTHKGHTALLNREDDSGPVEVTIYDPTDKVIHSSWASDVSKGKEAVDRALAI